MQKTIEAFCQICLRVDRKLIIANELLTDFHSELCDCPLIKRNNHFCTACEHLLKKMCNFKNKCIKANKILEDWLKDTNTMKVSASLLHTMLPPSSLGFWAPQISNIYYYANQETGLPLWDNVKMGSRPTDNMELMETSLLHEGVKLEAEKSDYDTIKPEISENFEEIQNVSDDYANLEETSADSMYQNTIDKNNHNSKSVSQNDIHLNDGRTTNNHNRNISDFYDNLTFEENLQHILNMDSNSDSDDSISVDNLSSDESTVQILNQGMGVKTKRKCMEMKKNNADVLNIDSNTNNDSDNTISIDNLSSNKNSQPMNAKTGVKRKTKCTKIKKNNTEKRRKNSTLKLSLLEKKVNVFKNEKHNKTRLNVAFSKERLKERLTDMFSSCGEIETQEGIIIEKDLILNSLDSKVTRTMLMMLWKSTSKKRRGGVTFNRPTFNIFNSIQTKCKEDMQYASIFDIEYLTTEDDMIQEFDNRKNYACYTMAPFKCELCYQGFKHKKLLEYHQKSHKVTAGSQTCSICAIAVKDKAQIKAHIYKVHEAVFKCKLCPLVTYYRTSMVYHYKQHNGELFKCEPCGLIYKSRSSYRTHLTFMHGSSRHVCTACGRAFVSELGKKEHVARKHKGVIPTSNHFKCPLCELKFSTEDACLMHQRSLHERVPPRSNDGALLDGPYRPRTALASRKKRTPIKQTVMTCRVCKATGKSYGWLYLHFKLKHPTLDITVVYADQKKYLCHVCGKGFSCRFTLRNHLNTHTNERPFACDKCPKRFGNNISFYSHRLVHLPPAKACVHCGKKFRSASNLNCHIRTHIGNRCFKCNLCGKGFLHQSALNAHVNCVHHHIRRVKKRDATKTDDANDSGGNETGVSELGANATGANGTGVSDVGGNRTDMSEIRVTRKAAKKMVLLMDDSD